MIMNGMDYRKEITLPVEKLSRYALLFLPLISLGFLLPYFLIWTPEFNHWFTVITNDTGGIHRWMAFSAYLAKKSPSGLVYFIIGIVLHELLHGMGWIIFGRKSFRSLQFGVIWKYLAPYAHCKEPVKVNAYRAGIILPGIAVGIIPGAYGLITGHLGWVIFGIIFTWGAIADFIMWWILRRLESNDLVIDHPREVGCYVLINKDSGSS